MRRLVALSGAVALALAGSQVAHALAYRLAEPDPSTRAQVLADTGHGYVQHLPLGIALVSVVLLVALVAEAGQTRAGRPGARPALGLFLLVAPLTFVCQEHVERLLHEGAIPWDAVAEPTFLLGLALQLPFALAAWLVARALLRAAQVVAVLARARARIAVRAAVLPRPRLANLPGAAHRERQFGPRGPPLQTA